MNRQSAGRGGRFPALGTALSQVRGTFMEKASVIPARSTVVADGLASGEKLVSLIAKEHVYRVGCGRQIAMSMARTREVLHEADVASPEYVFGAIA